MEEKRSGLRHAFIVGIVLALVLSISPGFIGTRVQADSGPIKPLSAAEAARILSPVELRAQQLALADAPVQRYAAGGRAEVFTILPFRDPFAPGFESCAADACYKVDIFAFDQLATISAVVDVDAGKVLSSWLLPQSHPLITPALYQRAYEIIANDPAVVAALGYRPTLEQTRMMDANNVATRCVGGYLCAGATFMTDSGAVWVLADLHQERIEKLWWEDKPFDLRSNQLNPAPEIAPEDCGVTKSVARNGWTLNYRTTPTDALEVTDVTWTLNGEAQPVATRMKLMEWHARYPSGSGYRDYTGCGGGAGGGFPIYNSGNTVVRDLYDAVNVVVGFEVVQDFRMSNWTAACNYRYQQHFEFYTDGRFRVKAGSFGKGCGNSQLSEATYRPVMMLDLAVAGANNDTFAVWDGVQWANQATEGYWLQAAPYAPGNFRYRIEDSSGMGYFIAPGVGQFNDNGTGDNAYTYLTLHRASEGDGDTGALSDTGCCNTDHRQGPHYWVDGEATTSQDLVMWYVPASATITTWAVNNGYSTQQYCWTDSAAANWPCYAGPMFVPYGPEFCSLYDFDCNYMVELTDLLMPVGSWLCATGDACYSMEYDLNADGAIDINDIQLEAAHWNCIIGDACYN